MLWLHIGTLMHRLAAEPRSSSGLLFSSRCPSWTILLSPYSTVWDWRVTRAGSMLFHLPKLLYPYHSLLPFFSFSVFLSIGWYCGAGVFGLIGCISLSLCLVLTTLLCNNDNNNNSYWKSRCRCKVFGLRSVCWLLCEFIWLDMTTPHWWREKVIVYYYYVPLLHLPLPLCLWNVISFLFSFRCVGD